MKLHISSNFSPDEASASVCFSSTKEKLSFEWRHSSPAVIECRSWCWVHHISISDATALNYLGTYSSCFAKNKSPGTFMLPLAASLHPLLSSPLFIFNGVIPKKTRTLSINSIKIACVRDSLAKHFVNSATTEFNNVRVHVSFKMESWKENEGRWRNRLHEAIFRFRASHLIWIKMSQFFIRSTIKIVFVSKLAVINHDGRNGKHLK